MWRTSITAGDLQHTVARYLGAERAERSFAEYAESRNAPLSPDAEADIHLLRFTEHLLASAIGAASSRLVLSLLLRRSDAGSQSALAACWTMPPRPCSTTATCCSRRSTRCGTA